ncbi:MAG: hypothetical protein ACRDJ4_15930 [Actinomycetota bacterium]
MPFRKTPRGVLAIALAVGIVALAGCSKDSGPGILGKITGKERPAAKASFKAGEVRGINPSDKAEAPQRANDEAPKVLDLLNRYYDIAFLDKKRWKDGTHPDLAGLFIGEAQPAVAPNLGALALADIAGRFKRVEPKKQEAGQISVLIEDDGSAPLAMVSAFFEASGETNEKADGPVTITHGVTFVLQREGDAYKIATFFVELHADTVARTGAFTPEDDALAMLAEKLQ